MDYSKTLRLPQTEFPMRGNLPQKEPQFVELWQDKDLYNKRIEKRKKEGAPRFVLHDGPPYANGKIHIGHALNKTLKDIIVRYKYMAGYMANYVPGWDTHGLPIEYAVLKDSGEDRANMSVLEKDTSIKERKPFTGVPTVKRRWRKRKLSIRTASPRLFM